MELYISIAALVLSVISGIYTITVHYFELRRARRQATLDAFNLLQNQVLDHLNHYRKSDIIRIAEEPRSDEYKKVSALLARCAHFAVGVNEGIYDKETVQRLAGCYFVGIYSKMEPLIEKKREINQTERHYEEFEKLTASLKRSSQNKRNKER